MDPVIPSDDIKKRIASLKEELDKKKAKLQRSLQSSKRRSQTPRSSQSPGRGKRVRFSDSAVCHPAAVAVEPVSAYVLSQNLFDDSQGDADVEETSPVDVAVLPVSCPASFSVSAAGGLVCVWWAAGARLFHAATLTWRRDCAAPSLLLLHLSADRLLVGERLGARLLLTCLLLEEGRVVSVVPVLAEDSPDPASRLLAAWGDAGRLDALFLTSADRHRCRLFPVAGAGGEVAAGGGRELPFHVELAAAVSEERAVAACLRRGRCQLALVDLRSGEVRRSGPEEGRARAMRRVGRHGAVALLAAVWETAGAVEVVLDAVRVDTGARLRLRRVGLDLDGHAVSPCGPAAVLAVAEDGLEKVEVDWERGTWTRRCWRLSGDVQWTLAATGEAVCAWRCGELVNVIVRRENA